MYKYRLKLKYLYHKLKTRLWYNFFLKECGHNNIIINPILIIPECLVLKNNIFLRDNCRLEGIFSNAGKSYNPQILIESNVNIEQNAHITCALEILIGEYTAISSNVTITDIVHPYGIEDFYKKQAFELSKVKIGSNCLILNNSVILPGVDLGNNCVVGANSIVKEGVYPESCLIVGAPARIVKRYSNSKKEWLRTNEKGDFI